MTFKDIYKYFIKPTKENFSIKYCTKQNERESDIYDWDIPFRCLAIDKRFKNYWNLSILYPYICKKSENVTTFGWVDRNGNIENSTQLWDEFVIGFQIYCDNDYDKLWNDFIQKIEEQYEE